jgi:hypothetical protein
LGCHASANRCAIQSILQCFYSMQGQRWIIYPLLGRPVDPRQIDRGPCSRAVSGGTRSPPQSLFSCISFNKQCMDQRHCWPHDGTSPNPVLVDSPTYTTGPADARTSWNGVGARQAAIQQVRRTRHCSSASILSTTPRSRVKCARRVSACSLFGSSCTTDVGPRIGCNAMVFKIMGRARSVHKIRKPSITSSAATRLSGKYGLKHSGGAAGNISPHRGKIQ